jgi:hypothetical protein
MPSIDYPGTRESKGIFQYSNTRVVGSSTRDAAKASKLKITATDILSFIILSFNYIFFNLNWNKLAKTN